MRTKIASILPRQMWLYFELYTSKGILLSICAVVIVGSVVTIMQESSIDDLTRITSEQQAVAGNTSLLNAVLLATVNAETSQRGYLISGNPTYLKPYYEALPNITTDFAKLKRMHQDKRNLAAINMLQNTVNQKLMELHGTLIAMDSGGLPAATAIVDNNKGLILMNSIRAQVNDIVQRQGNNVTQDQAHTLGQISKYRDILLIVRLATLLFVLIGMYLVGRAIYQRYELERSKGEFIDIAAHQLRTPASVVKLHLGAILGGYTGKLTSKQLGVVKNAYESNEHAIKIIEDVLKVAKVDSGDTVIHKETENVQQLLAEVIDAIGPTLKVRRQKIVRQFPKEAVSASLDAIYIRMVVENLLDNASKYSPEKSTITLGLKTDRQKHCIYVADNGVGIAKRDMSKLFKKFSRVDNELSDSITGSGLGLYWAQQIAELHGGKILVKSKEFRGSTFTLELPVRESL